MSLKIGRRKIHSSPGGVIGFRSGEFLRRTLRVASCECKGWTVPRRGSHLSRSQGMGMYSGVASTLADLRTLCRMGKQTGLTTPNKCLPIKGHFASCGHAGARVGFAVNFEG